MAFCSSRRAESESSLMRAGREHRALDDEVVEAALLRKPAHLRLAGLTVMTGWAEERVWEKWRLKRV